MTNKSIPAIKTPCGIPVKFYRQKKALSLHLRNHLLTKPECQAWQWAVPAMAEYQTDAGIRWQLAKEVLDGQDDLGMDHSLVALYHAAIQQSSIDAKRHEWFASRSGKIEAWFSPRGIAAIVNGDVLVTAYIPGAATQDQVVDEKDSSQVLPRQLSVRGNCRRNQRQDRAAQEVSSQWTSDQHLFKVFRVALQHIRSLCHVNPSTEKDKKNDLALLNIPVKKHPTDIHAKRVLPSPSMKLEEWKKLL